MSDKEKCELKSDSISDLGLSGVDYFFSNGNKVVNAKSESGFLKALEAIIKIEESNTNE